MHKIISIIYPLPWDTDDRLNIIFIYTFISNTTSYNIFIVYYNYNFSRNQFLNYDVSCFSKMAWISAIVFPFVSGIQKYVNTAITTHTTPNPRYVVCKPHTFENSGNSFTTRKTVRKAAHVTHPDAIPIWTKKRLNPFEF